MKRSIGFIGAGTVGTALAHRLCDGGYPVAAVADAVAEAAQRFARMVPGSRILETAQDVADSVDLVFVTTPDDIIPRVVSQLAWRAGQSAVHCSGAASLDVLEPARTAGAHVGSFHPCQAFASIEQAIENLPGSTFAIEASPPLFDELAEMAKAIGCDWIKLGPGDKALYHAAAVFASNYFVTVVGVATELFDRFGVPQDRATRVLMPLLEGTLRNIRNVGFPKCLTGPIARGDAGTIRKHIAAFEERAPEVLRLYAELGLAAIPIAVAKGTLSEEQARELREILQKIVKGAEGP